jgi:hypothetical protein
MNMNRQSRREDVLFVIALLVPAIFAGARYQESSREMTLIAQQPAAIQVVMSHGESQVKKS